MSLGFSKNILVDRHIWNKIDWDFPNSCEDKPVLNKQKEETPVETSRITQLTGVY